MKLSDIKGPVADQVNKKLLDKYSEILKGFASQLDPVKYYKFPTDNYGRSGLFCYNKEIKQFIVDGSEFNCSWYRKETPEKIKELVSIFNLKDKYWVIEEGFTFENNLFSCTMEILTYSPTNLNTISHSAKIKVKTKDSKQLLKELSRCGCLGNTLPGYSKLKDGKGIEIKVGDIVAYSDTDTTKVKLGKVTKLGDLKVTLYPGGSRYPESLIIVSREAITKI
jgi:hypothetical protein